MLAPLRQRIDQDIWTKRADVTLCTVIAKSRREDTTQRNFPYLLLFPMIESSEQPNERRGDLLLYVGKPYFRTIAAIIVIGE